MVSYCVYFLFVCVCVLSNSGLSFFVVVFYTIKVRHLHGKEETNEPAQRGALIVCVSSCEMCFVPADPKTAFHGPLPIPTSTVSLYTAK